MRVQDFLKRKDMFQADPRVLKIRPGWNARHDSPDLRNANAELRESIRANGVLEPLTIIQDEETFYVTNGHRRLGAVMALIAEGVEIATVPVRLEERGTNEADHVLSMLTRNSGKPLTPLETAEVVKRLLGFGWDLAKVAAKTGFTPAHLDWLLKLLETPEPVKALVSQGDVSATLAVQVVRKAGAADAPAILQAASNLAKADGKAKAKPRHVQEAMEARNEPAPPAPRARVDWSKVGPKLKAQVETALGIPDPVKALEGLNKFFTAQFGA